ncbi:MAG: 2-C-methyl-D-erythritol 2,4-cyclodiphosphate synthase [Atopobiaceae bacterium]|jgi:2-C-methyl-D-erythritol 2,4-cyclodiphosphate synthase|nr:2-C-methyl-D-erythritol 2,4-cyclodiphosphate synthase [Olegusella sp.]MCI1933767.1 2-C-methyl-D-erythritol 2,4-cyclodiphosphate synthase [Atopobiaceae bacterium]NLH91424.1 2-C-methyl-D-erythritol 2,4-cyclodiphosphate synthase [Atopobium sp.]
MMHIGHGYDVHALVEGRPLVLGGVHIDYKLGLEGHSDADVLTHALMDAILGSLREGDIGCLFPDDDPAYLGADSLVLLHHVASLAKDRGARIVDCDCTVAAQAPRLSPYRDQMRANLARAMGISADNVGVKATTTEHLGFVGRGEGIAAWSVVLLLDRPERTVGPSTVAGAVESIHPEPS